MVTVLLFQHLVHHIIALMNIKSSEVRSMMAHFTKFYTELLFFKTKWMIAAVKELNWEFFIKIPTDISKLVEVCLPHSVLIHTENRGQWTEENRLFYCSFQPWVSHWMKQKTMHYLCTHRKSCGYEITLLFQLSPLKGTEMNAQTLLWAKNCFLDMYT